jgi:LysR family transcriptional regulator, glycine cleavage system transcriptional activator
VPAPTDRLPLNALRAFEAVATRLNFTEAAEALHVSPAAVSQHIKGLEDYLQVPLFTRKGRQVQLTAEGFELLPAVRRGLGDLSEALHQVRQHRSGGPLQVTLLSSFLQAWLLPRIRAFRRRHPQVAVRLQTSREVVDFARSPVHVAVRLGNGQYTGLHSEKLMEDWLVPVASPELLRQHGPIARGASLRDYPLLQSNDEPWSRWSEAGADDRLTPSAATIDDSLGILAAAEEGLGYALARWSLAARSLQKGQLKLAGSDYLPFGYAYYFVCPKPYLNLPKVLAFRDWLRETAAAFPTPAEWQKRKKQR